MRSYCHGNKKKKVNEQQKPDHSNPTGFLLDANNDAVSKDEKPTKPVLFILRPPVPPPGQCAALISFRLVNGGRRRMITSTT